MAHILLVEDDKTIQLALGFALTKADYEVTSVADGQAALEAAQEVGPDLVLLDVMLPKVSGLDVARSIRAQGDDVPIIMLTALDAERDMIAGLDAGADDYVTKPFSTPELLARIRAHLRRGRREGPRAAAVTRVGALTIDTEAARVLRDGEPLALRTKEYQLLVALASRKGLLCTRQWLSEVVWGETFLPTSRTIDTHVKRLRQALAGDGWDYIKTEHGLGYRLEAEELSR